MPLPRLKKMALKPIHEQENTQGDEVLSSSYRKVISKEESTNKTIAELYQELKEKGHLVKLSE